MANEHSNGTVRVHPWVTYLAGLLLLAGSVVMLAASPDVDEEFDKSVAMAQARAFFERNPDVELSGRFAHWIGQDQVREARAKHEAKRQAGGVAVLSERMRAKTQTRFDALQKQAFASLENLPSWRFGVVGSESPFQNTFAHLASHETIAALGVTMIFFLVTAFSLEVAWGSIVFGGFLLLLPFLSAFSYIGLYGDQGVPWTGPSTMIAALLGAYAVRSLRGFVIPAWLLVPAWAIGEYLFSRDIPLDSFVATPFVLHGIGFGFGALAACLIWVLELEEKLGHAQRDTPDLVSNPVLEQALEQSAQGNPEAAFDLLEAELRQTPGNHDVAIALWEVSTGTDRTRRAVPVLLGTVRDHLRKGLRDEAIALWVAIHAEVEDTRPEGNLAVRIGEALLSEEQHEAGLAAFAAAVGGPKPLSSVLAMRIVRAARGLDPDLAGRAAAVALIDDQLGMSERAEMEAALDAAQLSPAQQPSVARESVAATPAPAEPDPLQDPHAISEDAFAELQEGETLAGDGDETTWNEPGLVQDLSEELADEEDASFDWSGLQDDGGDGAAASDPEVDTSVDLGSADEAGEESSEVSETTETLEPRTGGAASPVEDEVAVQPRVLRVRSAAPLTLGDQGISVDVEGSGKTHLSYARIEAVAAGAVRGLAPRPVLVVDLVLNWMDLPDEPLKVIRLRSDNFDPKSLVPGKGSALESLRAMLDQLLARTGSTPLPSRDAALGNPFSDYPDIASYDRTVLSTE